MLKLYKKIVITLRTYRKKTVKRLSKNLKKFRKSIKLKLKRLGV